MIVITYIVFGFSFPVMQNFFSGLATSPYLDMIKMLVGSFAWFGGLVLFVKWNEKRKTKHSAAA